MRWATAPGLPCVPEAARTLDAIGSEGRIAAAGRALLDALAGVPRRRFRCWTR